MYETYCGKDCGSCSGRETQQCSDHQDRRGEDAGGCTVADRGELLKWQKAPILSRWLWVLFWLTIGAIFLNLLGSDGVAQAVPWLGTAGEMLGVLCNLAVGCVLLKLAEMEKHYRMAGICVMISAVLALLLTALPEMEPGLSLVLGLPGIGMGICGQYHEYMGHAAVLEGLDDTLCKNWRQLWRWTVGLLAAVIVGFLLICFVPMLGVFALMVMGIDSVVLLVLRLLYLYRTVKLFRESPAAEGRSLTDETAL